MSVALVTILMVGVVLTGYLALWHNFNNGAVAMSDVMRASAQLEMERFRTALETGDVEVGSPGCTVDLEITNTGLESITPVSDMEVMISFPGGSNEPRVLRYRKNSDDPGLDTWWVRLPGPGEADPWTVRPGSTHTIRMGLHLPEADDTVASVIVATPNGVTATADVQGLTTPCSAEG